MPIDIRAAAAKYSTKTPEASGLWRERAAAASRKWEDRAKSPAAEDYWVERVIDAANNRARSKGLEGVSAADFEAGVSGGEAAYRDKVSRSAPKWETRFSPYAAVIDRVVDTLPAKTGDVRTNVANRVTPIATALREAKERGARAYAAPRAMAARPY